MHTSYRAPNFSAPAFLNAPDAQFEPAPADGVLPEHFFSTTNLPTYVKVLGQWQLPQLPRMDSAIVLERNQTVRVLEGRYVVKGQPVAVGYAEDGSEGIYVDAVGLLADEEEGNGERQLEDQTMFAEREEADKHALLMGKLWIDQRVTQQLADEEIERP